MIIEFTWYQIIATSYFSGLGLYTASLRFVEMGREIRRFWREVRRD